MALAQVGLTTILYPAKSPDQADVVRWGTVNFLAGVNFLTSIF